MGVPRVAWAGAKLSVIEVEQAGGEKFTENCPDLERELVVGESTPG